MIVYQHSDGGRAAAGIGGSSGDCVTRAIAIATGKSYREVHDALQRGLKHQLAIEHRQALEYGIKGNVRPNATPLSGISATVFGPYLQWLGWTYVAKPLGVDGKPLRLCKGHNRALPSGRLIVLLTRHLVAVIDGVVHDTYNSASRGRRPIHGYYHHTGAQG